jgi:hypothetical protein
MQINIYFFFKLKKGQSVGKQQSKLCILYVGIYYVSYTTVVVVVEAPAPAASSSSSSSWPVQHMSVE